MVDQNFIFRRLDADHERPAFDCGDNDLNEFFHSDSIKGSKELISVTYSVERNNEMVAFFCVSNDSIRSEDTSKSRFKKIRAPIDASKRYSSMPAVKIGRLAAASTVRRNGIGTKILDLIKAWFTTGNKTGCRFIIVDARNEDKVLNFYKKNGFQLLNTNPNKSDKTVLMFFDLITFKP